MIGPRPVFLLVILWFAHNKEIFYYIYIYITETHLCIVLSRRLKHIYMDTKIPEDKEDACKVLLDLLQDINRYTLSITDKDLRETKRKALSEMVLDMAIADLENRLKMFRLLKQHVLE